ncbi:hypothetical protein B0H19DRAFT_1078842 [Mycena capillaripes]|nr:hypothetical protein B0H19DRAFT_1078842 [Mycena capillaripes]
MMWYNSGVFVALFLFFCVCVEGMKGAMWADSGARIAARDVARMGWQRDFNVIDHISAYTNWSMGDDATRQIVSSRGPAHLTLPGKTAIIWTARLSAIDASSEKQYSGLQNGMQVCGATLVWEQRNWELNSTRRGVGAAMMRRVALFPSFLFVSSPAFSSSGAILFPSEGYSERSAYQGRPVSPPCPPPAVVSSAGWRAT